MNIDMSTPIIALLAFLVGALIILLIWAIVRNTTRFSGFLWRQVLKIFRRTSRQSTNTNKPLVADRVVIIQRIQDLYRLETSLFDEKEIITFESHPTANKFWKWLRNDSILMIAYGQVVAGIDLRKLSADNLEINETLSSIILILPAPEIFMSRLDNEKTIIHTRQSGIFARFSGKYKDFESEARRDAERVLKDAVLNAGILQQASASAHRQLKSLLFTFGFKHVEVYIGGDNYTAELDGHESYKSLPSQKIL